MQRQHKLSSRILTNVVAILVASMLIGFALITLTTRNDIQGEYEQRALVIAETFAQMPAVRRAMVDPTPAARKEIQTLAQQVRRRTRATYVVVINRHGVRYSHPDPKLIGKKVAEPVVSLDGRSYLRIDHGKMGASANARTPLRAPSGRIVGEVSAGIVEGRISDQMLAELPSLLLYFLCALGIGVIASVMLARRLKRSTFGLELEQIAALVQEREAMLHAIGDGVVTLDREGRITLVNNEARRLLGLSVDPIGHKLAPLLGLERLRELLSKPEGSSEQLVLTDEHVLVVSCMPVSRDGRELGSVLTVRDRTELEGLLRELDSVGALTNALRAQQHEFSNRMHTVAGLIELGAYDEAARYSVDISGAANGLADTLRERIERPELAALVLAKTAVAAERDVELELAASSSLADSGPSGRALLTIVGNLIDNAIDAAADGPAPRRVSVALNGSPDVITIRVKDSGRGVPERLRELIFTDGFTTKGADGPRKRGLGLALVHRLVHRMDGTISVQREHGQTTFTVTLPQASEPGATDTPPAKSELGLALAASRPRRRSLRRDD